MFLACKARLTLWLGIAVLSSVSLIAHAADEGAKTEEAAKPAAEAIEYTKDSFGWGHALTMFGEPKYQAGFKHFDYVNPNAPKGGRLNMGYFLPFDTLNAYALKGNSAPGLYGTDHFFRDRATDILNDTLMAPSLDEPQTLYPLIAKQAKLAKDFSWVSFKLNPKARWHDGTPITAEDVVYTFTILPEKGDPVFKVALAQLAKVEKSGEHEVTFYFSIPNMRKLPLIVAQIPILPKHYWTAESNDIGTSTLDPPLGSGPYKIKEVNQGRSVMYERVEDYWAANLPSQIGQNNFDILQYQAFRDVTVALEGIKSGQYDLREENVSRNWATAYNTPAVERGDLIKKLVPHKLPTGNQAFVFNTERYKDPKVREAIGLAWDFDWTNRVIFYDAYQRNHSFFQNTQFEARGLPSEEELALLEPFRDQLPEEIFTEEYNVPTTEKGESTIRDNLIHAQRLLKEAGYELNEDGVREHVETGETLQVEILYYTPSFDRVFMPYINNLKRLGIPGRVKTVEIAQYQQLLDQKDFWMTVMWYNNGVFFPGLEQRNYWHCNTAETVGSANYAKLCHPAVDALIDQIEQADTLEKLTAAAKALDRTLLWLHVTVPQYHISAFRMLYWNKFNQPETWASFDKGVSTWWMKDDISEVQQ